MSFASYILTRAFSALATIAVGAFVIFLVLQLAPGDPAITVLGENASPDAVAAFRREHGLDQPTPVQFGRFLTGAVRGDFGQSLTIGGGVPIVGLIFQRLPNTMFVGLYAMTIAVALSLVFGTLGAWRQGTAVDTVITAGVVTLISMPDFWAGYMLVLLVALQLGLFPAFGFTAPSESLQGALYSGFLPALTVSAHMTGFFSRILRSSLLETWRRAYVVAARSFGFTEPFVYRHYVLRNAVIPLVVVMGLQIRNLLGGMVIVEKIFGIPGLGSLMIDGVFARDYPLVLVCAMTFLALVIAVTFIVDVVCVLLDPRRSR